MKFQQILLFSLLATSNFAFSQIKEEQLILDRKREPEIKKIEKKKTSVETIKNYPPQAKKTEDSLNLKYQITDVPAVSDFKTSNIQAADISPKFNTDYQRNYIRLGAGNYSKFLGDINFSGILKNNMEIGTDIHFISTEGLKKQYTWNSGSANTKVGLYLNHYGENGRLNLSTEYNFDKYNYYGIYAFQPSANIDLSQKINQFKANAFYDFYSDNILDNLRLKTTFLTDYFYTKERLLEFNLDLAKNNLSFNNWQGVSINTGLGLGADVQDTHFGIVNHNKANYYAVNISPNVAFYKGDSYLKLGAKFTFWGDVLSNNNLAESKSTHTNIYPMVETLIPANDQLKAYAGIDGGLELNTFSEHLKKNPYLLSDLILKPTQTPYHFYFGVKGDLNEQVKYDLSAGYSKLKNTPFYTHQNILDISNRFIREAYNYANVFNIVYKNANKNEIQASIEYFPIQNLSISAGLLYEKYHFLTKIENLYNTSNLNINFDAKYTMFNQKLNLGFKAIYGSGNTVDIFDISPDINTNKLLYQQKTVDVKAYTDLNLSAEYQIHKNFSIFALANNLLNQQYQNFYGYKVLGIQILGGARISF